MNSMTGFGRAEGRGAPGALSVEIRSINHRYLDIACRLPEGWTALDDAIRAAVQREVVRGKVTVTVTAHGRPSATVALNTAAARDYLAALRRLQRLLRLPGTITFEQVAAGPGVVTPVPEAALAAWKPLALRTTGQAVQRLVSTRRREGRALAAALQRILGQLTKGVTALAARSPGVVTEYRARLEQRVRALTTQPVEPGRLEQEVAWFAKECDIAEEVTRIRAHAAHLQALLRATEPVGRTLDFVAQELQREVNTVGSKANDIEVSQLAICMKGWVEQLREQAQNLE
ncbi:MAG: YicC family protein [Candidatus Omnitrophica bacterium]|nr:YicC family protein [Candidatus Omnitrophota bacterium]